MMDTYLLDLIHSHHWVYRLVAFDNLLGDLRHGLQSEENTIT